MPLSVYDSYGRALTATPGVREIDYVEITSDVTVSGTSGAQTTVITGTSLTFENVPYIVEFFSPQLDRSTGSNVIINLWVDSTDLGMIAEYNDANGGMGVPCHAVRRYTPSAGTHQFIVKGYQSGGNVHVRAGAGGTATTYVPAFLRISKAG